MPISRVVVVVGYVWCRYSDVAISSARLHRILHCGRSELYCNGELKQRGKGRKNDNVTVVLCMHSLKHCDGVATPAPISLCQTVSMAVPPRKLSDSVRFKSSGRALLYGN